jgi:2',3'-cyclic-nucleotide 2'-phosphodiesterase (5'-nucleotidase family)
MAFGFTLLDFKLNMAATATYVQEHNYTISQQWFKEALEKKVDLYVLLGHAGLRDSCTFKGTYANENPLVCFEAYLRQHKPDVAIQVFGGHTHQRDFKCFDSRSSGLESGRYSDTVGWVALRGVSNNTAWNATKTLSAGVSTPTQTCTPARSTPATSLAYYIDRRYLDFNRRTFAYHAIGAQDGDVPANFDTPLGRKVSDDILKAREDLNLTKVLGCASRSYYLWVCPPGTPGNIYTLLKDALNETVRHGPSINPRLILMNNGSVRYDLYQGNFTVGDALTILPFDDDFLYIPNVNGKVALSALECLSKPKSKNPAGITVENIRFPLIDVGDTTQPTLHARRSFLPNNPNPGHVTHDDFGNCTGKVPDSEACGDDTIHQELKEQYVNPTYFQYQDLEVNEQTSNVDLVFISHFRDSILKCPGINGTYKDEDVKSYTDKGITTRTFLQEYAKRKWNNQHGDCQIGK